MTLRTAPWTPDEVDSANRWQRLRMMHPFTCANRSRSPIADVVTIQIANKRPRLSRGVQFPMTIGNVSADTRLTPNAHFNRFAKSGTLAFFH